MLAGDAAAVVPAVAGVNDDGVEALHVVGVEGRRAKEEETGEHGQRGEPEAVRKGKVHAL